MSVARESTLYSTSPTPLAMPHTFVDMVVVIVCWNAALITFTSKNNNLLIITAIYLNYHEVREVKWER